MDRWLRLNPDVADWDTRYEKFAAFLHDTLTPALEVIRRPAAPGEEA